MDEKRLIENREAKDIRVDVLKIIDDELQGANDREFDSDATGVAIFEWACERIWDNVNKYFNDRIPRVKAKQLPPEPLGTICGRIDELPAGDDWHVYVKGLETSPPVCSTNDLKRLASLAAPPAREWVAIEKIYDLPKESGMYWFTLRDTGKTWAAPFNSTEHLEKWVTLVSAWMPKETEPQPFTGGAN